MDIKESRCQIFTPYEKVQEMLNLIGYNNALYGKKVLENSFGKGAFLLEIVKRYVNDCFKNNITVDEIKVGLENDIYGIEIDKDLYDETIILLNEYLEKININKVKWNLYNEDALKFKLNVKFQYIVGNPPYIRYKNMDNETRLFIRSNYETCKDGLFDMYYAFVESSYQYLDLDGQLVYVIPNSIYKNKSALTLRSLVKDNLKEIINFKRKNVFSEALTSVTIIHIDKTQENNTLIYSSENSKGRKIYKDKLDDVKWIFYRNLSGKRKFGDYFKVGSNVATLRNEIFVIKNGTRYNEKLVFEEVEIEFESVRSTGNASSFRKNQCEYIIFPYYFDNQNKLKRYTDELYKETYPLAHSYLLDNRKELDERKKDMHANWFEFGRSQAISWMNRDKLYMSTVVTKNANVYVIGDRCVPYSGLYIIQLTNEYNLEDAKAILESDRFLKYVQITGKNIGGSSLLISPKDVINYKY